MAGWNDGIIEEFRANEGRVGGSFEGATMLLLHTTGRRTGREHVTPAVYLPDDGRWVVIGSKGGAPADPDWIRNLEANPEATIEVGTETVPVRATRILREGPEWERLYAAQVARRPGFVEYLERPRGSAGSRSWCWSAGSAGGAVRPMTAPSRGRYTRASDDREGTPR